MRLIAIMLGRLEMDVDECIDSYTGLMKAIFGGKLGHLPFGWSGKTKARFDSSKLASAVEQVVIGHGLGSTDRLNDDVERGCKVFVCTTANETTETTRLRSYSLPSKLDIPSTICQAALATSAATTFFDPVYIGARKFVDGGLGANNPVDEVEGEASNIWCSQTSDLKPLVKCFISIGTGNPGKKAIEDNIIKLAAGTLKAIATETEKTAERFAARWRQHLDEKRYFRFNVHQGLQDVGLAECAEQGRIEAVTNEYLAQIEQKFRLRNCVINLKAKENHADLDFAIAIAEYISRGRTTVQQPSLEMRLIYEQVENIKSEMKGSKREQRNEKILSWLSHMSFETTQRSLFAKHHPGTGSWFLNLDEFIAWRDCHDQFPPVLWSFGIPGVGKSVMTAIVIDQLERTFSSAETAIAYVFCEYKDRENQTAANLLSSLVKQIVSQHQEMPPEVDSLYTKHRNGDYVPTVDECSELLSSLPKQFNRCFIVVDALDEHIREEDENNAFRTQFLDQLLSLQAKPGTQGGYSIFLTSRESNSIRSQLDGSTSIQLHANESDVRSYITARLASSNFRFAKQVAADPALQAEILKVLVGNAQGMFLLPDLHLKRLGAQNNIRDLKKALRVLPKTLSDTYSAAMTRISRQSEEHRDLALRTLVWILHAYRPLRVEEIQHALAVEPGDDDLDRDALVEESHLISVSAGLIILDAEQRTLNLVHLTLTEYLASTKNEWFPGSERAITETCLTYLSFRTFATGPCKNTQELGRRLQIYALYSYAAKGWGAFARKIQQKDIEPAIFAFLDLPGNISSAVQLMQNWTKTGRDQPSPENLGTIHIAAYFGLTMIVEILLCDKGADIEAIDSDHSTPLHYAAANGYEDTVELLLSKGAGIFSQSKHGFTALYRAAYNGHIGIMQQILNRGRALAQGGDKTVSLVNAKDIYRN